MFITTLHADVFLECYTSETIKKTRESVCTLKLPSPSGYFGATFFFASHPHQKNYHIDDYEKAYYEPYICFLVGCGL